MTNMASIGIIVLYLVGISLINEARCQAFVTVECLKSEIVAQYGTNTILDCVIKTQSPTDTKIVSVSWMINDTAQLVFHNGKILEKKQGFDFAVSNWNDTTMNVSLLITKTDLSHTGLYECNVATSRGGDEAKVHLAVKAKYSKPKIDFKINPQKDFSLTCKAHGGFPKGDLRWVVGNQRWMGKPEEELREEDTGLLDLSSKLTFNQNSPFQIFVCEVYNANGVKEGEGTFDITISQPADKDAVSGDQKGLSPTQIVAPVVVIGSLIVGLLLLLLFFRRKQRRARRPSAAPLMNDRREVPPDDFDSEAGEQEALRIDNIA